MKLVDSCGWLEFFADGPNADFYARALQEPEKLVVSSVCLLEVFKSITRQGGEEKALVAVAAMLRGRVVSLDTSLSLSAARQGIALRLPLADSVIYATARAFRATILTQDEHFRGLSGVSFPGKKEG